ncbi:hypothetical protein HRbin40_01267 [bacterium HR40]|nr:hypothetical protein HRbin40_01267 [bacterium HR40]
MSPRCDRRMFPHGPARRSSGHEERRAVGCWRGPGFGGGATAVAAETSGELPARANEDERQPTGSRCGPRHPSRAVAGTERARCTRRAIVALSSSGRAESRKSTMKDSFEQHGLSPGRSSGRNADENDREVMPSPASVLARMHDRPSRAVGKVAASPRAPLPGSLGSGIAACRSACGAPPLSCASLPFAERIFRSRCRRHGRGGSRVSQEKPASSTGAAMSGEGKSRLVGTALPDWLSFAGSQMARSSTSERSNSPRPTLGTPGRSG